MKRTRSRALVALLVLGIAVSLSACLGPPPPPYDPGPDWHASAVTIWRHVDGRLVCIRSHESSVGKPDTIDPVYGPQYDQGYQASNGSHFGAYQFAPSTWDRQAAAIGRGDLVGRRPDTVWIVDQDLVAWSILASGGNAWGPDRC